MLGVRTPSWAGGSFSQTTTRSSRSMSPGSLGRHKGSSMRCFVTIPSVRRWSCRRRTPILAPNVIEGQNQTTQAPYCAAYLTILATKYGSFIPALSEHHAGGTNVGRVVINGERLGGQSVRERYFLGSGAHEIPARPFFPPLSRGLRHVRSALLSVCRVRLRGGSARDAGGLRATAAAFSSDGQ